MVALGTFSLCHAPRERVSWNMLIACLLCAFIRHAPRERVSWNFCTVSKICATHRHAPRERVSWNTRHHWWTSNELVTLHVSVWVEIKSADNIGHISIGHAPRERVSWNCWQVRWTWFLQGHAPRERVSWNFCFRRRKKRTFQVTLHVSVWVEIYKYDASYFNDTVTLHVSVWVEM